MKKILPYFGFMLFGSVISTTTVLALIAPHKFPDVDYNSYYGPAVDYVSVNGIMTGYSNGNFGPNDMVNRAQLATVLNRYDEKVTMMKSMICLGIKRDDVFPNTAMYDELCPQLVQ